MSRHFARLTLLIGCCLAGVCCGRAEQSTPVEKKVENSPVEKIGYVVKPRGDRLLGFGVTQGGIEYVDAFEQAKAAGIQFVELAQQWKEVEVAPGRFESPLLPILNSLYAQHDVAIVLSVNPIDTARHMKPDRFSGVTFKNPELLDSFKAFVDFVLQKLPDVEIVAVSIGNEIDTVLTSPVEWEQYAHFASAVRLHLREKLPSVPIGVKTTLPETIGRQAESISRVNRDMDAVMVTYYPLDENIYVVPPQAIIDNLHKIVETARPNPVFLLEVGYPSSHDNRSSMALQSEYIDVLFKTWDQLSGAIPLVNFVWTHDMTRKQLSAFTRHFSGAGKRFATFAGSLGLHDEKGNPKPAWRRLKQHVKERGWGKIGTDHH